MADDFRPAGKSRARGCVVKLPNERAGRYQLFLGPIGTDVPWDRAFNEREDGPPCRVSTEGSWSTVESLVGKLGEDRLGKGGTHGTANRIAHSNNAGGEPAAKQWFLVGHPAMMPASLSGRAPNENPRAADRPIFGDRAQSRPIPRGA